MSTATNRLRRAGVGGVAAAVAIGTLATAGTAFAVAGTYSAASTPNVTQGASNQLAGDLSLEFADNWKTNASQTFTVGTNNCSTTASIAKAIGFSSAPTVSVANGTASTAPGNTPGFGAKPALTVTLSSSDTQCATAGIKDVVTVSTSAASPAPDGDTFVMTLGNVRYNVGTDAATGAVSVTSAPGNPGFVATASLTPAASVTNANVVNTSYTFMPVVAALPSSTGNVLGTAKFVESTAGAYFPKGSTTTVTLVLSAGGTYTPGVTPTITAPAGYVVSKPVTNNTNTYTFTVTAPATATTATVSVAGLKMDAANTITTVTETATVGTASQGAMPAANVVNYNARTGGADRYATAAALFTGQFNSGPGVQSLVLSGGGLYPDALSANYLAGKLGTGTLLTGANTLASAARQAIISSGVSTVYITGGTGAISTNVENEIKSMHQSNAPMAPFINVIRLGGQDRYKTNMIVNEYNFTASNTVLLASGKGFADALSLGPIAYNKQYPLILTTGSSLGASENTQLNDFNPSNVVIAGGTGVVSQAVEDSLKARGYNVLRLAGQDRTQTAAAVATWATTGVPLSTNPIAVSQGFNSTTVYVTTGQMFADALSAGPVAGSNLSVIMPGASSVSLGNGLPQYLGTKKVGTTADGTNVATLHALGLTGATSYGLLKAAAASIGN